MGEEKKEKEMTEKELLREMIDREKIIISSILFDANAKQYALSRPIRDDFFTNSQLRKMIQAFNALADVGIEPTENLIIDQLLIGKKNKNIEEDEVLKEKRLEFLLKFKRLKETVPQEGPEAIEAHLDVLKKNYLLKQYEQIAEKIKQEVKNKRVDILSDDVEKLKHYIENAFFELEHGKLDDEVKSMTLIEGVQYNIQKMKEALHQKENAETVTTGYPELDESFNGGYLKGTYNIIAGRPAMGKTVVMLNHAVEAAKAGAKVLFISIEMNLLQCFQRILSKISSVAGQKIQQPKFMSPKDWEQVRIAAKDVEEFYGENFWIDEVTELTPALLERKIKQYVKQNEIDIVFVDYAQIMLTNDGNEPKEQSDFAQISGALRRVSKAQNVAVVVGSQLSRGIESRPDKRPIMSDIRNSGAFEQDAARIMGLYRDEVYNKESDKPNILEMVILKDRFGKGDNKSIEFNYDLECQSIFSKSGS